MSVLTATCMHLVTGTHHILMNGVISSTPHAHLLHPSCAHSQDSDTFTYHVTTANGYRSNDGLVTISITPSAITSIGQTYGAVAGTTLFVDAKHGVLTGATTTGGMPIMAEVRA